MPLRSDSGRLPRRNRYQEGPDFLFLATQGGRPPTAVRRHNRIAIPPGAGDRRDLDVTLSAAQGDPIRRHLGPARREQGWRPGHATDSLRPDERTLRH